MERYEPTDDRCRRLLAKARRTNGERDAIDRRHGLASPGDLPVAEQFRVILDALFAGLATRDWPCVAEGAAMLQDLEASARQPILARSVEPSVEATPLQRYQPPVNEGTSHILELARKAVARRSEIEGPFMALPVLIQIRDLIDGLCESMDLRSMAGPAVAVVLLQQVEMETRRALAACVTPDTAQKGGGQ